MINQPSSLSPHVVTTPSNCRLLRDKFERAIANPIPFDLPRDLKRASRATVRCYNAAYDTIEELSNVLLPNIGAFDFDDIKSNKNIQHAYYQCKDPIETIMGHVEICYVLEGPYSENDNSMFRYTGKMVAVKVNYMKRMDELRGQHAEDPVNEIAAMQLVGTNHPNVTGCTEVLFDTNNVYIVMPHCDSGDLFDCLVAANIDDIPTRFPEDHVRVWFRQIMSAIQYMHEQCGLCHRDISLENVMVHNNRCVVIDMGMSLREPYELIDHQGQQQQRSDPVILDLQTAVQLGAEPFDTTNTQTNSLRRQKCFIKTQGRCGKLTNMPPEIYRNKRPFDGEAVDVWSAGTVLFCMITGSCSYTRPHKSDELYVAMTKGIEELLEVMEVDASHELVHLLKNMLQIKPSKRLTIKQIMNHPWFNGVE